MTTENHGEAGMADQQPQPTDAGGLQKQIEDLKAQLQKVNDEAANRRVKAREEKQAKEAALAEQQQYKALAESLQSEVQTLRGLEDKASQWDAHIKSVRDSLEADIAAAPDWAKVALNAMSDPMAQRRFLDSIPREPVRAQPHTTPTTAPSAAEAPDLSKMTAAEAAKVHEANPGAFADWFSKAFKR